MVALRLSYSSLEIVTVSLLTAFSPLPFTAVIIPYRKRVEMAESLINPYAEGFHLLKRQKSGKRQNLSINP